MNLNKLFPRLAIRAKLTIAFVVLAGFPVALVAAFATWVKVDQLRGTSTEALNHDLQMARAQMEHGLQEAEENVAFLTHTHLAPTLAAPTPERLAEAGDRVTALMRYKPALHQVKLIDADGRILLVSSASGGTIPDEASQPSGTYYAYRAQLLEPGTELLLPVELRGSQAGVDGTIPVVAIITPITDSAGLFLGAVAGESYAAVLFGGLDKGAPHLPGVTGLVDQEGFFLYHSERKRDWASLLALRTEVDLQREFSPEDAAVMMSGGAGTLTARGQLVSFTALTMGSFGTGPLYLYRAVDLAVLDAPIRSFMRMVSAVGLLIGLLVLGLAVLAASQFTRPIYGIAEAMRRLAAGGSPGPLEIDTNDELEDLAGEFTVMATSLTAYRQRLEELVAERTRALHETYGELASILAHSADAVIGLDLDGRVRVWNRSAESLFGYEEAEALGQPVDALIGTDGRKAGQEEAFLKRRLDEEGAVRDFRTERAHRHGHVVPVSLSQSVIRDDAGHPIGYSLILRDATLQSRLEAQMRRSERLAAASVMAAAFAHEVNNPLAIIGNRIECMQRDVRSACPECPIEGDLAVLREQSNRLVEVTRDLLSMASDQAEEVTMVDVEAIAGRIVRLVEPTFSARDVRLELRCSEQALPRFTGHEKALETVVLNLLLNAADVTPPGGTVWLETGMGREGTEVGFSVRDSGAGVPAELRERIFEPFFTTKGPRGGTGLGLAVCRTVVERHGGRITVEAAEGGGSRFVVAVPVGVPVTP